jgi:outer membrane protein TolC
MQKAKEILTVLFSLLVVFCQGPFAPLRAAGEPDKNLTLKEAVDIALKQHPSIRQYQETVAAAQSGIGVSRAGYFPQFSFVGNFYYGNAFPISGVSPSAGTGAGLQSSVTTDFYIYRFQMNQLIYDFGKTPGNVAGSRATYSQSREDYLNNRQLVVLDARTAYFSLLAAQRAQKVQEETVRQNQELLRQAQGFFKVGLRAKYDVTKAEANLYQAEANLISAKNNVDLARVTLLNALGLKTWAYTKVEDVLEVTYEIPTLADLKTRAMVQRPDLQKNLYQQQGGRAAVEVARSGYFPVFTSTAAYGWQGNVPLSSNLPSNWWVGAVVNFPLFEGLATTYSVRQAKATLESSIANEEVLRQNITRDVEQAYRNLVSGRELIRATAKAREAAQENLRLAWGRYRAGVGTIIEVTDAQVQFSQADLNYVQALYNYRVFEANLDKAIGRPF